MAERLQVRGGGGFASHEFNVATKGRVWVKNDQRTENALFRTGGL